MEEWSNVTIAAGPVIIQDNKVLLDMDEKEEFWKFPGGRMKQGETAEATTIRRAGEELNINVEILKSLMTMVLWNDKPIVLIHFLADFSGEPKPGKGTKDFGWFYIDDILNGKVDKLAPNIAPVVEEYIRTK